MRIAVVIALAAGLAVFPDRGQAVDCSRVHTVLERTMCSDTQLLALGREFNALADEVRQGQQQDGGALSSLRNGFARRCRSSSRPGDCLRRQHLAGIDKLRRLLATAAEPPRAAAKAAPELGASVHDEHGELAMLEIYRKQIKRSNDPTSRQRVKQLQALVRSACSGDNEALRQRLPWYGLSCGRR